MRFPIKIDDAKTAETIRGAVSKWFNNTFPYLNIGDEITNISIIRESDHIAANWQGTIEADIPGPNPDALRARLYATHAEIDARISGLRVSYK